MRKGISLITLIITIIVIIILIAAVILSLSQTNILDSARESVIRNDIDSFETLLFNYIMDETLDNLGEYNPDLLFADGISLTYNGKVIPEKNIFDIIEPLEGSDYEGELEVYEGELIYVGDEEDIGTIIDPEYELSYPEIELLYQGVNYGFTDDIEIVIKVTDKNDITNFDLTGKIDIYYLGTLEYTDASSNILISSITDNDNIKQSKMTITANSISEGGLYTIKVKQGVAENNYNKFSQAANDLMIYIGDTPPIPDTPIIVPSTLDFTSENIEVIINYSSDSVEKLYSFDNITWNEYTNPLDIANNTKIYAKSINAYSGVSELVEVDIQNIDKINPSGTFTPADGSITRLKYTVTFNPSDNISGVNKWKYRVSNDNGVNYGDWSQDIIGNTNADILLDSDGINKIQVEVIDNVLNTGVIDSAVYNVDSLVVVDPIIQLSSEDWVNQLQVTIIFGDNIVIKEYRIDGGNWQNYTNPIIIDTNCTIETRGSDEYDNNTKLVSRVIDNIDEIAPEGVFSPNSKTTWDNTNLIVTFTPSDIGGSGVDKWRYRVSADNGTNYGSWSSYVNGVTADTITLSDSGKNKIQVEITDNAGTTVTKTSGEYYIDKIAPSGSFSPNSQTLWGDYTITVSFNPSDGSGSGVDKWRYRISTNNGSSYGAWSSYINGDTTNNISVSSTAINKVQVEVIDNVGNSAIKTSGSYYIDKIEPSGYFSPNSSGTMVTSKTITFYASDSGGSGMYRWRTRISTNSGSSYGLWSSYQYGSSGNVTMNSDGTNVVQSIVYDNAGNYEYITSGTFSIGTPPPSWSFGTPYATGRYYSGSKIYIYLAFPASGISYDDFSKGYKVDGRVYDLTSYYNSGLGLYNEEKGDIRLKHLASGTTKWYRFHYSTSFGSDISDRMRIVPA